MVRPLSSRVDRVGGAVTRAAVQPCYHGNRRGFGQRRGDYGFVREHGVTYPVLVDDGSAGAAHQGGHDSAFSAHRR